MLNILVESVGLVDAAFHRVTQNGEKALHQKLQTDQSNQVFHNFITTEYSIITANRFLVDYIEKNKLQLNEQRRLLAEFRDVLEQYFSDDQQYIIYAGIDIDSMLQIGEVFQKLDPGADIEEAVIGYIATGPYNGAQIIGLNSPAYAQLKIPMYYGF
jgi:hypothetical protein